MTQELRQFADSPEAQPGTRVNVANRRSLYFVVGRTVNFPGRLKAIVRAAKTNGLVLEPLATEERVAQVVQPEQLLLWRGVYWWCAGVHGLYVTLAWYGTNNKPKPGWRIFMRDGKAFTRAVAATEA